MFLMIFRWRLEDFSVDSYFQIYSDLNSYQMNKVE